ncbi:hypothetical protein PoB_006822900 [Plakobranchus ocellatus]|uniref:Uncharacterized protein n=1 Tax=Plakobranchus ocellatus TaxID=259542 RepID=A0AAV4DBY3_9GAST|nr:hypothetical protein PoB_006822900 [Plakobranchus ocellatus]
MVKAGGQSCCVFFVFTKPSEIHKQIAETYGEGAMSRSRVYQWCTWFGEGRTSLGDEPKSGRPKTSTNEENTTRVDKLVRCDRRMKIREIALKLEIPKSTVHEIVHDTLGYRKVSARWVPKMLTEDYKLQRLEISQRLLQRCQQDNRDEDTTHIGRTGLKNSRAAGSKFKWICIRVLFAAAVVSIVVITLRRQMRTLKIEDEVTSVDAKAEGMDDWEARAIEMEVDESEEGTQSENNDHESEGGEEEGEGNEEEGTEVGDEENGELDEGDEEANIEEDKENAVEEEGNDDEAQEIDDKGDEDEGGQDEDEKAEDMGEEDVDEDKVDYKDADDDESTANGLFGSFFSMFGGSKMKDNNRDGVRDDEAVQIEDGEEEQNLGRESEEEDNESPSEVQNQIVRVSQASGINQPIHNLGVTFDGVDNQDYNDSEGTKPVNEGDMKVQTEGAAGGMQDAQTSPAASGVQGGQAGTQIGSNAPLSQGEQILQPHQQLRYQQLQQSNPALAQRYLVLAQQQNQQQQQGNQQQQQQPPQPQQPPQQEPQQLQQQQPQQQQQQQLQQLQQQQTQLQPQQQQQQPVNQYQLQGQKQAISAANIQGMLSPEAFKLLVSKNINPVTLHRTSGFVQQLLRQAGYPKDADVIASITSQTPQANQGQNSAAGINVNKLPSEDGQIQDQQEQQQQVQQQQQQQMQQQKGQISAQLPVSGLQIDALETEQSQMIPQPQGAPQPQGVLQQQEVSPTQGAQQVPQVQRFQPMPQVQGAALGSQVHDLQQRGFQVNSQPQGIESRTPQLVPQPGDQMQAVPETAQQGFQQVPQAMQQEQLVQLQQRQAASFATSRSLKSVDVVELFKILDKSDDDIFVDSRMATDNKLNDESNEGTLGEKEDDGEGKQTETEEDVDEDENYLSSDVEEGRGDGDLTDQRYANILDKLNNAEKDSNMDLSHSKRLDTENKDERLDSDESFGFSQIRSDESPASFPPEKFVTPYDGSVYDNPRPLSSGEYAQFRTKPYSETTPPSYGEEKASAVEAVDSKEGTEDEEQAINTIKQFGNELWEKVPRGLEGTFGSPYQNEDFGDFNGIGAAGYIQPSEGNAYSSDFDEDMQQGGKTYGVLINEIELIDDPATVDDYEENAEDGKPGVGNFGTQSSTFGAGLGPVEDYPINSEAFVHYSKAVDLMGKLLSRTVPNTVLRDLPTVTTTVEIGYEYVNDTSDGSVAPSYVKHNEKNSFSDDFYNSEDSDRQNDTAHYDYDDYVRDYTLGSSSATNRTTNGDSKSKEAKTVSSQSDLTSSVKQDAHKGLNETISEVSENVSSPPISSTPAPSPVDPSKTCPREVKLAKTSHPVTALVMFPGAAVEWVKKILEQLTGQETDSIYSIMSGLKNGNAAGVYQMSKKVAIETHAPTDRNFERAIVIIDNPYAVEAKHRIFRPYSVEWQKNFLWGRTYKAWLSSDLPLHVMSYDDLVEAPLTEIIKMAAFVGGEGVDLNYDCALAVASTPPPMEYDLSQITGIYRTERRRINANVDDVAKAAALKGFTTILPRLDSFKVYAGV